MTTARNLNNERFAVITARRTNPQDECGPSHYRTCGHASPTCPGIKPDSRRINAETLGQFLMDNEYFDGEIVYDAPFRCRVCHPDLCNGGTCHSILDLCSKHSAAYQREYGRASNE